MELVSWRIKINKTEDCIHKRNGRPIREGEKRYKIINITISESTAESEMIFLELDWEENASYGQKHLREMNNRLCKVSTA